MPFPESPRVVFTQNTIAEAVCQLRFPTVLAIASEPPAQFQEAIRSAYPIYERQAPGLLFDLPGMLAERMPPLNLGAPVHRFYTEDRQRQISLGNEFVAVSEARYTEWSNFRPEIVLARQALEENYRPAFYDRIGLRYQNAIKRQDLGVGDVPWRDLLRAPVAGMLAADEPISEAVRASTSATVLAIRADAVVRLAHGLADDDTEKDTYVVDCDFYTTERSASDHVDTILDDFNRRAGNLFRWTISDRLRDALL